MNPITILLVDDHDVVRTGLRSFLNTQSDVQVMAEARNGEEALQRAEEVKPDLVIMDITRPGMDGLEATRKLKARNPDCLVLALTVHDDIHHGGVGLHGPHHLLPASHLMRAQEGEDVLMPGLDGGTLARYFL